MRRSAKQQGVSWTTIRDHITLCTKKSKAEEAQNRQCLIIAEKEILEEYCL
jgi:hypothetical protein